MRISYWSSYVCSSDLGSSTPHPVRALAGAWVNVAVRTPVRVAGILNQTARQQLAVRSFKNKPPRFFSAPATRFNATLSPHRRITGVRIELEIGRASGRERGCQYV